MTSFDPGDHDEDSALILRARDGDDAAYAELFNRHSPAALSYARSIAGPSEAEDLVAEAFTKLWSALGRDLGPVTTFRPYLLTTIRRLWANTLRSRSRVEVDEDIVATADRRHSRAAREDDQAWSEEAIGEAFRRLPDRWREVLWLTTVDGYSQAEVARHLNIKANAVAALNFRAREGLRREYLAQHLVATSDPQCRATLSLLPGLVRESLDAKKTHDVNSHLQTCPSCGSAAANLSAINEHLGLVLPAAAVAGLFAAKHISVQTSVPAMPATRPGTRRLLTRAAYATAAATALVLGAFLWPGGATPSARPLIPVRTPSPQVQVIDLGRIPRVTPRRVQPRHPPPSQVTTNQVVAPPPPAPTPPPPAGGGGTTVSGTTGGHTPATISASAS